jgi:hypothetical protein
MREETRRQVVEWVKTVLAADESTEAREERQRERQRIEKARSAARELRAYWQKASTANAPRSQAFIQSNEGQLLLFERELNRLKASASDRITLNLGFELRHESGPHKGKPDWKEIASICREAGWKTAEQEPLRKRFEEMMRYGKKDTMPLDRELLAILHPRARAHTLRRMSLRPVHERAFHRLKRKPKTSSGQSTRQ